MALFLPAKSLATFKSAASLKLATLAYEIGAFATSNSQENLDWLHNPSLCRIPLSFFSDHGGF